MAQTDPAHETAPAEDGDDNAIRTVYFVRHAVSIRDDESPDGRLEETGRRQAERTADVLSDLEIDALHTSDYRRARATAEIVRDRAFPELELHESRKLREFMLPGHPRFEDAELTADEARERLEYIYDSFLLPDDEGGSTTEIAVAHGNVIRGLVTLVIGADLESWLEWGVTNCGVTEINGAESGKTGVTSYNAATHLPLELRTTGGGEINE